MRSSLVAVSQFKTAEVYMTKTICRPDTVDLVDGPNIFFDVRPEFINYIKKMDYFGVTELEVHSSEPYFRNQSERIFELFYGCGKYFPNLTPNVFFLACNKKYLPQKMCDHQAF